MGLATGTVVLPNSPSEFRRRVRLMRGDNKNLKDNNDRQSRRHIGRQNDKTAIELASYAILWWIAFGLITVLGFGGGVSRRLVSVSRITCLLVLVLINHSKANMSYVLWVSAYNTSFILFYLLVDMAYGTYSQEAMTSSKLSSTSRVPGRSASVLLEAINTNGLVLFLVVSGYSVFAAVDC